MLEREGVTDEHRLATWSLRELPAGWPGAAADGSAEVDAVALADHRAAYLDYEGPISGDRGAVSRIAAGDLTWSEASERRIACELRGDFGGELILTSHLIDQWRLEWRGVGA
jgi:hypothetical protein